MKKTSTAAKMTKTTERVWVSTSSSFGQKKNLLVWLAPDGTRCVRRKVEYRSGIQGLFKLVRYNKNWDSYSLSYKAYFVPTTNSATTTLLQTSATALKGSGLSLKDVRSVMRMVRGMTQKEQAAWFRKG